MSGLFYGMNIVRNTLKTKNAELNIAGHNIANANTPGYSRQSVMLTAVSHAAGSSLRSGTTISIGEGVDAKEIKRTRFAIYDKIFRNVNQDLNNFIKTEELMSQVEIIFDEPSERGLSSILNDFFNGWQEVANAPQSMAARQSLKSLAIELTNRLHRVYRQLETMSEEIDYEIAACPDRINEITLELSELNSSFRVAESHNTPVNDLLDKWDVLIDELSVLIDVRTVEQRDGTITVIIGSNVVVERTDRSELYAEVNLAEDGGVKKTIIKSVEGIEYNPQFGKLGALVDFRDKHVKEIQEKLDIFAESLVTAINYEHRHGYGLDGIKGRNFFEPNAKKAFSISISRDINDVRKIAVSGDGSVGDNGNALIIDNVKNLDVVEQKYTFSEYYNWMIADIGIKAREAHSSRINKELLAGQIDNAREGIMGVSIDEELVQMIQAQRIYQSASRLIVVLNLLFEEIINFMK